MASKNVCSTRKFFPSFLIILLGISLFLVQCNDKILNSSTPITNRDIGQSILNDNNVTLNTNVAIHHFQKPDTWNGDLVVYAHGYVDPQNDLAIPNDKINGISVATVVNSLGMAYATTSYPHNGLNGPEAVADLIKLVNEFKETYSQPRHIYLVGASEGGLISTLSVEQHPEYFSGGLAVCGPVGNFKKQLNYFGDFHVLFHYFFPDINVGTPIKVGDDVISSWLNGDLKDVITNAISNNQNIALTLLNVAKVPVKNSGDIQEITTTILDLLRYNILATDDTINRLGGHPFDNTHKYYRGTGSFLQDIRLNRKIKRYKADYKALHTIQKEFETSGELSHPIVTMHTSGDQIIPYWQEPIYTLKTFKEGSALLHNNIPIIGRYGHCNLTLNELLTGFGLLVYKVSHQNLSVPSTLFSSPEQEQDFLNLSKKKGLSPSIKKIPGPIL
jgi:hypothetical protein